MRLPHVFVFVFAALSAGLRAQVAPAVPAASPAAPAAPTTEAVVLSPFAVNADSDTGYAATSTLGGTR
ncbi:MAG: hypothetical protein B9S34_14440 [Opitutia bacterium Tous-C1TDCM]|nr:MAG: hypothetical protein B9S34_14440 [Opitutae bacterium Tous-C1TDCM]